MKVTMRASTLVWNFPVISARAAYGKDKTSHSQNDSLIFMNSLLALDMMHGRVGLLSFDISFRPTRASSLHIRQVDSSCLALRSTFFFWRYLHCFLCVLCQCSFWHMSSQYHSSLHPLHLLRTSLSGCFQSNTKQLAQYVPVWNISSGTTPAILVHSPLVSLVEVNQASI